MQCADYPDFSIITPSLNSLNYLICCCASVEDQAGACFEHIVMDGGSQDGTVAWLQDRKEITTVVQRDCGMYDAINKGLSLAQGQILSYLNCDEQYLLGTLKFVKDYFAAHPRVDLLFGDALLIRPDGSLIAYRKGYTPRWFYILTSHLYVLSCAMFFRRRIVEHGFFFNPKLQDIGDQDFVVRVLRHGYRAAQVKRYLGAFTMTGANRSAGQNALHEARGALDAAPDWIQALRIPLNAMRLGEKFLAGAYSQKMPLEYSVYGTEDLSKRKVFRVQSASFRWQSGVP